MQIAVSFFLLEEREIVKEEGSREGDRERKRHRKRSIESVQRRLHFQ